MNTPKKQLKIPSWLPTTVAILAIVTVILLIYIIVTSVNKTSSTNPTTTPSPEASATPLPTEDPEDTMALQPLAPIDSQTFAYEKVSSFLLAACGDDYQTESLQVSSKASPKEGSSLLYAMYKCGDTYKVSELVFSGTDVKDLSEYPALASFAAKARISDDVTNIYIQALISNFYYYRNKCDVEAVSQLLITGSQDDAKVIIDRMKYLESISFSSLLINSITSDTVDYVVFLSEEITLVSISTPAPGLSELLIARDENSYPLIFIGTTDEKADAERTALKNSASFKALYENVSQALNTALESDSELKTAYENMLNQ